MTENQELRFALHVVVTTGEQAKRRAEREVDESEGHSGILPTHTKPCS